MSPKKLVYYFGDGLADGDGRMKELLGGKGANLAEMSLLRIPVPAGFTITTEVCTHYYENKKKYPAELKAQVDAAVRKIEKSMGRGFGDPKNPLLVSVRSGARASMPGMMETVLNVGLTTATIPGLIAKSNERFVWDAYRRLIMMYSDVVMEKAAGVEVEDGHGIRHQLEAILKEKKAATGATLDTDLSAQSLKEICVAFKERIKSVLGKPFPDTPQDQLWGGVNAVFSSWMGKRAIDYRRIERIPDAWGTAVNVQSMVFGNLGDTSSTGVAFTRDPGTGANEFYGEYLVNAQGEDVVAGIRTPSPILKKYEAAGQISLERQDPKCFKQLNGIRLQLEKHFRDMLDIEFTIEENVLYMLQCRVGKRNGTAAVRIAVELLKEKQIDARTAVMRVQASQLTELLLPTFNEAAEKKAEKVATGLPAGPGAASGKIVFRPDEAKDAKGRGEKVILVRTETSPEDVDGMHSAEGILTAVGGMSSHAALVARGFGKTCIVGCSAININYAKETMTVGNKVFKKGDILSLNGTKGVVYSGEIALDAAEPHKNPWYATIMKAADKFRTIKVRANADAGKDAAIARKFGAEGIGLCRTEHMFFGEERIRAVREMILSNDKATRVKAISKLLPFQRNDFKELFTAMNGLPVTIRLLDPPLHEFVPHHDQKDKISELAHEFGVFADEIHDRIKKLHESNPMLGHRGCRLGITYPEITEMQARAIFEAAAECQKAGIKVIPEIMVPLVGHVNELANQEKVIRQVASAVMAERKIKINYLLGTMIELPRACLTADQIARNAEFFSFGTNDLTQTTFGFSRDDIGTFLPDYLEKKILPEDPFQSLDQAGVGQLVEMGISLGRSVRPTLKVGICGEHGGDPASVVFCHKVGMDYVSCSPYRVPIALFAAAQAAVIHPHQEAIKMAAAKKVAAKKPAAKKVAAKKPVAKKAAAAKKPVAKKAAAKKPAAKKKSGPSSSKGKKS